MNFTHYRQKDQMDCGPTCLRMVARYYGKTLDINGLRNASSIGKEGVNLLGIAEAAEATGFRAQGVQINISQLADANRLPGILHWSQQHFVVLYKVKHNTYYIADSAVGLVNYPKKNLPEDG